MHWQVTQHLLWLGIMSYNNYIIILTMLFEYSISLLVLAFLFSFFSFLFLVNFTRDRIIWEGNSIGKMPSDYLQAFPWLMIDVGVGLAHCGWCHPLAGGPGKYNKEQSIGNRQVSSICPWSLLQFLPPGFCLSFQVDYGPWCGSV